MTCDALWDLEMGYRGYHEFCHEDLLLGILRDDRLTILKGYASDLCSPGWYLLGEWYGTPSKGKEDKSIVHDFTRQFMRPHVACSPWDRKATDDIFYNGMRDSKTWGKSLFHGAVAGPIGSAWMWLNKPRPDVYCRCIHPTPIGLIEGWTGHKSEKP